MTDVSPAPLLAYATPTGYASGLTGAARLGRLIVAPRLPDGTVELPHRCVLCNGPAERQWRRSAWYFRRGYLWWLMLSIYGLIGLGITAWISHRKVRVTAGLCRSHWAARRWRLALGSTAIVVGVGSLVTSIVIDNDRTLLRSIGGAAEVWVPALGIGGFALAVVGVLYVGTRGALLKPIWADEEIACLAGAGLPFLEGLPVVGDGVATAQ